MPAIDVPQIRAEASNLISVYNDASEFARLTRAFFNAYSDPLFRRSDIVTIHSPLESYGTPAMVLRTLVGSLRKVATAYPQFTLLNVQALWVEPVREQRLLAAELLGLVAAVCPAEAADLLNRWRLELNDLDIAEALAVHVAGAWILGEPRTRLEKVREWVNSPHKHQRQFGVLSLLPLAKQRSFADVSLALATLTGAMREDDPEVRKSVARILRELSLRSPSETVRFLTTWADTLDKNTDWIVRHAVEKLDADTRQTIINALRTRVK